MSRVSYKVMVTLSCRLPVNITDLEYTFQNRKIKSMVRKEGKRKTLEERPALFRSGHAFLLLLFIQSIDTN